MAKEWRRLKSSDTWHFCANCSNWPRSGYKRTRTKPRSGELCDECRAKAEKNECR
jgi:hypothetical protein